MKKKIIRYLIYLFAKIFLQLVLILPFRFAVFFGAFLGKISFYFLKESRNITINNLKIAFPEKNDKEILTLAENVYIHLGKNLFELFSFPKINKNNINELVKVEGLEYLDKALSKGKGVIIITGHIGNWEVMAAYYSLKGYNLNVIAKKVYDERLNDILVSYRNAMGTKVLLREESMKEILKVLKTKDGIIGMLIDQDTNVKGTFVNFFNRPAYTPTGATLLSMKYGMPVIPSFITRLKDGTHKLFILPEVSLDNTGNKEQDIINNTQKLTKIIEDFIKRYPEQWVWIHKRWKTKVV